MDVERAAALDERLVGGLEDRRRAAMVSADVVALSELLHPDCLYVHSTGAIESGQSYLDRLGAGTFGYDAIEVDDRIVSASDHVAVVVYRQVASMKIGPDRHQAVSRCTATWVSHSGTPRLLAFQATPIR